MTTILIIEDNDQNMYMLTYLLQSEGYHVLQAYSGPEGITMAAQHHPDVVLLDIQLPMMDGYAVAVALRRNTDLAGMPIIVVTSYAMPGDRERALASGATGYIEKPINPDTFIEQMISFLPETLHPAEGV